VLASGPGGGATSAAILRILDADAQGGLSTKGGKAAARRLREAIAQLQGCFYGLSEIERQVITLRVGLQGQPPHSRRQVAGDLGRSRTYIKRTERRALRKLFRLERVDGCASGGSAGAGVVGLDGVIAPADLAAAPGLVAFANPAVQAARQSRFTSRGAPIDFPSPQPGLGRFRDGNDVNTAWLLQLLGIMLLIALGGFTRAAPALLAALRERRREALPAPSAVAAEPNGRKTEEPAEAWIWPEPIPEEQAQAQPNGSETREGRPRVHA
jgi:hypothetical protein